MGVITAVGSRATLGSILATTLRRRAESLDIPLRLDARAGNQSTGVIVSTGALSIAPPART
jgi:hypothetical protein